MESIRRNSSINRTSIVSLIEEDKNIEVEINDSLVMKKDEAKDDDVKKKCSNKISKFLKAISLG